MKQEYSDFFFNRPIMYFGSCQEVENEIESTQTLDPIFPFSINITYNHHVQYPTGLYLHWFDSPDTSADF